MVSAVVIVKNEEKNIVDCLDCLGFCSEIVVVDDYSSDRTPEILEKLSKENPKIKIFKRKLGIDFSAQRNFGVEQATNDWVLFIDADERVTKELAHEIKNNLSLTDFGGFLIKREDFMWGKELKHGETGSVKLLRLFNKNKGSLKGTVHEVWQTKSKVGKLVNSIKHYPHPSVSEFLSEINFYTDLRAKELFETGVKTNLLLIILYAKGKFIVDYIFKMGFKDGKEGFVHAVIMSFHSFLVRGKLWLLWQKNSS